MTPGVVICCLLHYVRSRCFNKTSRYTQRGIKALLTEQDIKMIWFRDKAWLLTKPSLDRINGLGNYELNNCRFIELKDNYRRLSYRVNCKTRPWIWKRVSQFSKEWEYIKTFKSIEDAANEHKLKSSSNIIAAIKRKGFVRGYHFKRGDKNGN